MTACHPWARSMSFAGFSRKVIIALSLMGRLGTRKSLPLQESRENWAIDAGSRYAHSPASLFKPCVCTSLPTNVLGQVLTPPQVLTLARVANSLVHQWLGLLDSLASCWTKGLYPPRASPFHSPLAGAMKASGFCCQPRPPLVLNRQKRRRVLGLGTPLSR